MVGSLNLNVVVSDCDQVGDGIVLHHTVGLEEGANLPLLVIVRVEFLKLSSCRDYRYTFSKLDLSPWHKSVRTHLDPPLCSVSDYERHFRAECLCLFQDRCCRSIQEVQRLDHVTWDNLSWIHQHRGIRCEEACAQECIVPVKYHTSLMRAWTLGWVPPHSLVNEF